MISNSKLSQKLQNYSKSQRGQSVIGEKSNGLTLAQGDAMAKNLIFIIRKHITFSAPSIAHVGNTLTSSVPRKRSDGFYEIVVKFNKEALYRKSIEWNFGATPYDGIWNIVALFNNGYDTEEKTVYGTWHSTRYGVISNQVSLTKRDPLYFMQAAVDEFNGKYKAKYGITVTLGGDYQ